jgi:hypothetical protein
MGCNCGTKKTAAATYVHTDKDGVQTAYKSQTEAEAAKVRRGGTVKAV